MKTVFKTILFWIAFLLTLPFFVVYGVGKVLIGDERAFQGVSQAISLVPGMIGTYMRSAFYHFMLKNCDRECHISFGTFFPTRNVTIGKHVYIGARCIIADSDIEDDVLIGSNVNILGKSAHHFDRLDIPIRLQGGKTEPVTIGQDSWLGNCSIIMGNIGNKCIIGAGSVVTKDIEEFSIAVGNPAKIVKHRQGSTMRLSGDTPC